MADDGWQSRLNKRPIRWWVDLVAHNQNLRILSIDPSIIEYNYTRSFHPVRLEQWIQVFQKDEWIDMFSLEQPLLNAYPMNWQRFIWHQDALHRMESHHETPNFFQPIGNELPHHLVLQAFPSGREGEYYYIHLHAQQPYYVWGALYDLLHLDYCSSHFASIGIKCPTHNSSNYWLMAPRRMRRWLDNPFLTPKRVQLSDFRFPSSRTAEIIRACGENTSFSFTNCLFEVGNVHFSPIYLTMVLLSNPLPPSLLYGILRANVEEVKYNGEAQNNL
jgi:hypothetical protein